MCLDSMELTNSTEYTKHVGKALHLPKAQTEQYKQNLYIKYEAAIIKSMKHNLFVI